MPLVYTEGEQVWLMCNANGIHRGPVEILQVDESDPDAPYRVGRDHQEAWVTQDMLLSLSEARADGEPNDPITALKIIERMAVVAQLQLVREDKTIIPTGVCSKCLQSGQPSEVVFNLAEGDWRHVTPPSLDDSHSPPAIIPTNTNEEG